MCSEDYLKIKNSLTVFFIIPVVFMITFILACSKEKKAADKPAVPVAVEPVIHKSVPVQIYAIGTVEAYSSVSVKARVGGELTHVYFKEGQDVAKGNLLFTIDSRPYKAALESAQANLLRDTALSRKAEEDLRRYTELFREELVSRSQYEQVFSNAEALRATVEADKAAVENARLQVEYCSIYSPISGRTGSLLVNEGNLIKANDDKPMVVINQIQPVYVSFSVPEKNLPEIKRYMAGEKLKAEVYISGDDMNPQQGVITFIDNTVDIATGTVKLKGLFPNKDKHLWPGQFVTVSVTLSTIQNALVVPSHAIQTGQHGQFVFVVKGSTAEIRPVTTGIAYKDMTVIEKGLAPDELVVTDGQMRLTQRARVEIKTQEQKGNNQRESLKPENPAMDKAK